MNTKTITITVAIIIVLALAFMFYPKHEGSRWDTPLEALDKSTQDDTTSDIDADLDSIDVDSSSSKDFDGMDADIKSI